ncbi:MAG TPA: hypothetical protein VGE51_09430 [Fontimonas sp.]
MDDSQPANERVSTHLRQATHDGQVRPGARLDAVDIARLFDIT